MQVARLLLLGIAMMALVAACALTGCGSAGQVDGATPAVEAALSPAAAATAAIASQPAKAKPVRPRPVDPIVVLHTSAGDIQIQLFREKAPQTVDNFLHNYALREFYVGTIFHHVEAGSMIIGGGYTSDLAAKETRSPIFNESQNGLKNTRGAVAMIRDPANTHSASSQFFINLADNPALDFHGDPAADEIPDEDWGYCVFGQVIAGLDVVDRIAGAEVAADGDFTKLPVQPILINSVEQIR